MKTLIILIFLGTAVFYYALMAAGAALPAASLLELRLSSPNVSGFLYGELKP